MEGKGTARADAAARAPTEVTIDPARQQLGGMVTTTFLGLLVLPALYFIWRGRRYPRAHRRDEAALEPGGGPVE